MKKLAALPILMVSGLTAQTVEKPNIILIYIDDMGYADLTCYGGDYAPTPNIDRLADEGIRFTQYYSACPISSPSRAGVTSGMYPTRWGITTFLNDRASNARNFSNDFLLERAPSMARTLSTNGYATGHFGKWHMGGGRDVSNAPPIPNYGFDEYVSTYESPDPDPKLTSTNWIWAASDEIKRWDRTAYFVDKTLDFLSRHTDQPCFVNLWPDDVHTPWVYEDDGGQPTYETEQNFTEVLAELDVQIGRLMQGLKDLGIDENTMVIFTSDNGPAPAFSGNRTDDLRGQKATLYEGGIRMPFIVRWPGTIPAGEVDANSVLCSVDLLPSFCTITGTDLPTEYPLDGEDMSQVLLGAGETERTNPLFWEFGIHLANRVSPHIAVREGDWKLLVNADGSNVELYNMKTDYLERTNVALFNPDVVNRLKPMAIEWFEASFREFADNIVRVSVDGDAAADGSSWEDATTIEHAVTLSQQNGATQIWMKAGTYSVNTTPINFDNLLIYGGFAGTESKLSERDWHVNQTVFDGNNSVSPLRNSDLGATVSSVLDGVIVQNGLNKVGSNGSENGGGMILANGATVRNCIFRNNRTQNDKNGAAIHCHSGNIKIENSLFVNNTSTGNGGAVQVGGGTTATLINCTFANNQSTKPGGAFGLGNNTSNLTLINTVAYNNLSGASAYNSFGQNDNINGGGTVLSKNSAIESPSTKFTDGDDIAHITLTRDITPQFVAQASVIGYTNNPTDWASVEAASYQLADESPCIDAGNVNLIASIEYDLAHNKRISGNQIDIGAYEFDSGEVAEQRIIRVAPDGDADADGSSWANATTLTKGVALSNAYINEPQIWLKSGIYSVTSSINFDNLIIYGGFDGTEQQLEERNWHVNQSILDGGNTVSPLRNNNLEALTTSVLDGVIVQNGINQNNANGNGNGGAMILANGAVVRNCIFRNNRTQNAKNGAAIHCHLGSIRIENSLFTNNTSSGNGGAIQIGGGTGATVINCTFVNNQSVKFGGAFGLGASTSNLTLVNTIAYNNMYGDSYNSYGQNESMHGGGVVVSLNSAIESSSTKFTDGDDVEHIQLTRALSPEFLAPAAVIGYSNRADNIDQIENASYQLTANSICVDAGNSTYAGHIPFDLANKSRVQGAQVDLGAYEFNMGTSITNQLQKNRWVIHTTAHSIDIDGIIKGELIALYDISGKLVYQKQADGNSMSISLSEKGFYILKIENEAFKLLFQ